MTVSRTRMAALALATAALPASLVLAAAPANAADGAMVSVLHGIPGATVDVYVNGDLTLDDFKPGDLAGPLTLPGGTYSVEITDPTDKAKVIIGPADIPVENGMNYTIVAYLGTDGQPTAKPFVNDTSMTKAGEGRVTVRHVANAPEVKVLADGATLVPSLANGNEAVANVPAKSYAVAVEPASGGDAVFSTDLAVQDGVNTIVYAYGDLAGGTFATAVQSISGLESMPGGVPAGEAGLANDGAALPGWALAALAVGVMGLALTGSKLVASRNRI